MSTPATTYDTYAAARTPGNLRAVVEEHRGFVNGVVRNMVGHVSPVIQTRAHLLAAEAVKRYDPARKVPLKSWIATGLMPIHRVAAKSSEIIRVPEALRRESMHLARSKAALAEKLLREPSPEELADHSGIPLAKQRRIASGPLWVKSEGSAQAAMDSGGDDADASGLAVGAKDDLAEIQDYVYHDLDDIDKMVFRYRSGYDGAEKLPNMEIAKRLNLSPSTVTYRANRLQKTLEEAYQWR